MKYKKLDYVQFTIDWTQASTVSEVAQKHGLTPMAASQAALRLRRKGVKLKSMKKKPKTDDLNALVELFDK